MSRNKIMSIIMTLSVLLAMSTMSLASVIPDTNPTPLSGTESMVGSLLGMVEGAAFGCASGMLIYIGIKYTMASANEKADLKNSSIKYLIGAMIIYALSAVFAIIQNIMNDIGGSLG